MGRIRVFLDTSVVRGYVHGDPTAQPLASLSPHDQGLSVALVNSAVAELTIQLVEGRLTWDDWGRRIPDIDRVVDQESPIGPNETEWESAGNRWAVPTLPVSRADHMRAMWSVLRGARSTADLTTGTELVGAGGFRWPVAVTPEMSRASIDEDRRPWVEQITDYQSRIAEMRKINPVGSYPTADHLAKQFLDSRRAERPDDPTWSIRHDGHTRAFARFLHLALTPRSPYNASAEDRQGDAHDLVLLMALAVPALVCTLDGRLLRHVELTKSVQSGQVLRPAELLSGAECGDLIQRFPVELRPLL
jgi:hypothetical protein